MRPIFALTRHSYDSYTDYRRLVDLSGFETCFVDQMDLQDSSAVYIVSPVNGEFRHHLEAHGKDRRARLVWWNLERPDPPAPSPPLSASLDGLAPLVDAIWVSDRHYATMDPRLRFVVLGSHPGLGAPPALPLRYDFTHQSYVWGRRSAPIDAARRRWKEGGNAWGDARDAVLRSTRVLLNIHQTPAPIGEPLRFALAAAYHLPLVTETLADGFPLVAGQHYFAAPLGGVPLLLQHVLLTDEPTRAAFGAALYERLCVEHTFRRGVEDGIRSLL